MREFVFKVIFGLSFIIFILYKIFSGYPFELGKNDKRLLIKGVILKKFQDSTSKFATKLFLNDYTTINIPRKAYDYIEVGDSIYKPSGSNEYIIFKKSKGVKKFNPPY
jgi:hypothetical protein